MLHSICQQMWKTQQRPQDWGKSVFIPIPKKGNAKGCSNYHTIALISHTSKIMLKIFQARVQQYVNWELPDVETRFRKGGGTRDQIAKIWWIIEKAREFQKTFTSASLTMLKPLTVWITTNYGIFVKEEAGIFITWRQTTLPASWGTCMQDKKQQLERDVEQQTGSKLGKEYIKTVHCHPANLTYMQSTSYEMPGWRTHQLESRLPVEISTTSYMQMLPLNGRKWRGIKEPLDEVKEGSEKLA